MAPLAVRGGKEEGANPGKGGGAEGRVGEVVGGTAMTVWGSEEGNIWGFWQLWAAFLKCGVVLDIEITNRER